MITHSNQQFMPNQSTEDKISSLKNKNMSLPQSTNRFDIINSNNKNESVNIQNYHDNNLNIKYSKNIKNINISNPILDLQ